MVTASPPRTILLFVTTVVLLLLIHIAVIWWSLAILSTIVDGSIARITSIFLKPVIIVVVLLALVLSTSVVIILIVLWSDVGAAYAHCGKRVSLILEWKYLIALFFCQLCQYAYDLYQTKCIESSIMLLTESEWALLPIGHLFSLAQLLLENVAGCLCQAWLAWSDANFTEVAL